MARSNPVTILLVDDEPMMISVIKAMLEHLDCQVLATIDAVEALDMYNDHAANIDLVLVDQMMPQITGLSFAEKLYEQNPKIKVVLMTGSSVEDFASQPDVLGVIGYLQKPFSFDQLETIVEKALAV